MPIAKKECMARALEGTGLLSLLERFRKRPCVVILNFHRIGTSADCPFDRAVFSATVDDFDAQLAHMRRHYRVLSIDDIHNLPETVKRLDEPAFMVTFDDGYRDNYELAVPVLHRHQVPAVFFVATQFVTESRLPWWDAIAYIVRNTNKQTIKLESHDEKQLIINTDPVPQAIRLVQRVAKAEPGLDYDRFVETLSRQCQVALPVQDLVDGLFMNEEMLRESVAKGMLIGSHTHSHSVLGNMDEIVQRHELAHSRRLLAEITGTAPRLLAYPVGGPDSFNEMTKRLAVECGYTAGFAYYGGVVQPGHRDWFNVPRLPVDQEMSMPFWRMSLLLARKS